MILRTGLDLAALGRWRCLRAAGGVGRQIECGTFGAALLLLDATVLEPNLHLLLGETQSVGNLDSAQT